jgi:Myb-like DNA-binding domain
LLNYVKKYGKEWEKIGVMIGRTALNVRDKYKELGGSNNSFRTKSNWTVEETLQLIKLVEKYSKIKILTDNVDEVLTKSVDDTDFAPKRISKTNIKF